MKNKRLARWLQVVLTVLMPIIAVAWLLASPTGNAETSVSAAAIPAQAEKKVTINGVDSTRIDYELDDETTERGVFRSDQADDERDNATGKIKAIRVLRQDGTVFPDSTRDCAGRDCTVVVNTNRGAITVKDAGNNTVSLTYPQRQTYRYSCRRGAAHSRRVNVQSVKLTNPDFTINCPQNKCSAEITYTSQ